MAWDHHRAVLNREGVVGGDGNPRGKKRRPALPKTQFDCEDTYIRTYVHAYMVTGLPTFG